MTEIEALRAENERLRKLVELPEGEVADRTEIMLDGLIEENERLRDVAKAARVVLQEAEKEAQVSGVFVDTLKVLRRAFARLDMKKMEKLK